MVAIAISACLNSFLQLGHLQLLEMSLGSQRHGVPADIDASQRLMIFKVVNQLLEPPTKYSNCFISLGRVTV